MDIVLTRFAYTPERTLGQIVVGSLTLATIERPWIPNPAGPGGMPRESCVPEGTYAVRPHDGGAFQRVWALVNPELGVWYQPGQIPKGQRWGRSAILIHAGNLVRDVVGCIAVGRQHGAIKGEPAVILSQLAIGDMRRVLGRDAHTLVIRSTEMPR